MTEQGGGLVACPACGKECLVLCKPRYEGFTRVGEDRFCAGCGHRLPDSAPLDPPSKPPPLFSDEDRIPVPNPFQNDERGRLCRYCAHYILHPFRQWCSKHQRDTEATKSCPDFTAQTRSPPEA